MHVSDIVEKGIPTLLQTDTLERARKAIVDSSHSALPVLAEDGTFLGELSEIDLLRVELAHSDTNFSDVATGDLRYRLAHPTTQVSYLMRNHGLVISPSDSALFAASMLLAQEVNVLPVVENNKLVGVVTAVTLLRHFNEVSNLR